MDGLIDYWTEVTGEFLQSKRTGALVVTGEWGSGKTHLFKNVITKAITRAGSKSLYVSLYSYGVSGKGLDDFLIEELSGIKDVDDKSKASVGTLLTGLFTGITSDPKNSGVMSAAVMAVGSAVKKRIIDSLDGYVLCFDDLDRLDNTNFSKAWAEINYYSEFKSRKVILLLDETRLSHGSVHSDAYEKNIWKDVPIKMTEGEALNQSLNMLSEDLAAELEKVKNSHLLPVVEALKIKNIRTIASSLDMLGRVLLYKDSLGGQGILNLNNVSLLYQIVFLASLVSKRRGKKTESQVETLRSICNGYYQRQLSIMMLSRQANPVVFGEEDLFIQSLPSLACNGATQFGFITDYILHSKLEIESLKNVLLIDENAVDLSDRPICSVYERLIERAELSENDYLTYFEDVLELVNNPRPGVCNISKVASLTSEFCYDAQRGGLPVDLEELSGVFEGAIAKWQALVGQEGYNFECGLDDYFFFRRGLSDTSSLDKALLEWNEVATEFELVSSFVESLQGWFCDPELSLLHERSNHYSMPLFKYLASEDVEAFFRGASGKTLSKLNAIIRSRFSVTGAVLVILDERDALVKLREKFAAEEGFGYRRVQCVEGVRVVEDAIKRIDQLKS